MDPRQEVLNYIKCNQRRLELLRQGIDAKSDCKVPYFLTKPEQPGGTVDGRRVGATSKTPEVPDGINGLTGNELPMKERYSHIIKLEKTSAKLRYALNKINHSDSEFVDENGKVDWSKVANQL